MRNKDMPVNVTFIVTGDVTPYEVEKIIEESHNGLTKREYFASKTPENPPKWFEDKCHSEWSVEECEQYFFDDGVNCGFSAKGKEFIYFAWRTYYADALLKELENE